MKPLIVYKQRAAALQAARKLPRRNGPALLLQGGWYLKRDGHVWFLRHITNHDEMQIIAFQDAEYALDEVFPRDSYSRDR
jgi:uncharacterized protein (DUF1330 family)